MEPCESKDVGLNDRNKISIEKSELEKSNVVIHSTDNENIVDLSQKLIAKNNLNEINNDANNEEYNFDNNNYLNSKSIIDNQNNNLQNDTTNLKKLNNEKNVELCEKPGASENKNHSSQMQVAPEPDASETRIDSIIQDICINYCLYHLVILTLCVVIIVLVFVLQAKLKYSEGYFYSDIHKSWSQNLVSSIYTSGCERVSDFLINDEWPGTQEGCNCYTSVRSGICGKKGNCTSVPAKDPIPFKLWRGARFCRLADTNWKNKTYFDLDVNGNASDCAVGLRSCGAIDSFGNQLCVDNNKACPVNDIKFYEYSEYEKIKSNLTNEETTVLAANGVLVYSNKKTSSKKIVVDLKISNGQPCLNPYYENIGPRVYVLDVYAQRNYCFKYTDSNDIRNNQTSKDLGQYLFNSNYQEIDKINMQGLYFENQITQVAYDMPKFPKDIYNRDISLYSRNYFGLKTSCYNNVKKNNMGQDLMEDLNKIKNLMEINTTPMTVFTIIMVSLVFILCFTGVVVSGRTRNSQKVDRCFFWSYFGVAFVTMAIAIALAISLITIFSSVKFTPAFDYVFNNLECVDTYLIELYNLLVPNISFITKSALACSVLSGFVVILLLLFSYIGYVETK